MVGVVGYLQRVDGDPSFVVGQAALALRAREDDDVTLIGVAVGTDVDLPVGSARRHGLARVEAEVREGHLLVLGTVRL